jgi:tRNA-binding EMAP/Myf-like protein
MFKNKTRKNHIRRNLHGKITNSQDGWTTLHIFGEPKERGFAHGFLLKKHLIKVLQVLPFIVKEELKYNFDEYMRLSNRLIRPIVKKKFPEFYQELVGISEGANEAGVRISVDFLIAWNALLSLSEDTNKLGRCSAFIATGNATAKGDIIMGHNTHSDFATGMLSNVVIYVTPSSGKPFCMQTSAGLISSATDWFVSTSGIMGCETTISNTNYTPVFGSPCFCRIRQAMQYGNTMDDYVKIMSNDNAGDYPCSWLFGDIKTNEIMLFEQGLHVIDVKRKFNGVFYGMNSAISDELRLKETTDTTIFDIKTSSGSRNYRLDYLLNKKYDGNISIKIAKEVLGDHYDSYLNKNMLNSRGICKHVELDGEPENKKPYYPFGCTDSKIIDSEMASRLCFMGRIGCCCGKPFLVKPYLEKHPEYGHWKKVLEDIHRERWSKICL